MEITALIQKKLSNGLTREEERMFYQWLNENKENRLLFRRLDELRKQGLVASDFDEGDLEAKWMNILRSHAQNKDRMPKHGMLYKPFLNYAAIFLALMATLYMGWLLAPSTTQTNELDPNAITLRLQTGETRMLSDGEADVLEDGKGHVLGTIKPTLIDYTTATKQSALVYNTLTVPFGKRFSVLLSDSSKVELNAGSSLKYPIRFLDKGHRQVFLTGEAFFEVQENKAHPFIVTTASMDVRVLGTSFNVTAYAEEDDVHAVLVEGSVDLYKTKTAYSPSTATRLSPGQKGAWGADEKATVKEVDTQIYTGWRSGKLILRKMRFEEIIRKLERHYNIQIENEYKRLDNRVFTATFDIETINEVLETFRVETQFHYEIIQNHITIKEPLDNP